MWEVRTGRRAQLGFKEKENKYCLKWFNGKLHEEYESFSALRDEVGLLKLMSTSLGISPYNSSQPWAQIKDLLLICDKKNEIPNG